MRTNHKPNSLLVTHAPKDIFGSDETVEAAKKFPDQVGECSPTNCMGDCKSIKRGVGDCPVPNLLVENPPFPTMGIEAESQAIMVIPKPTELEDCYGGDAYRDLKHHTLSSMLGDPGADMSLPQAAMEIDESTAMMDVMASMLAEGLISEEFGEIWSCLNKRIQDGFGVYNMELVTTPFNIDSVNRKADKKSRKSEYIHVMKVSMPCEKERKIVQD